MGLGNLRRRQLELIDDVATRRVDTEGELADVRAQPSCPGNHDVEVVRRVEAHSALQLNLLVAIVHRLDLQLRPQSHLTGVGDGQLGIIRGETQLLPNGNHRL